MSAPTHAQLEAALAIIEAAAHSTEPVAAAAANTAPVVVPAAAEPVRTTGVASFPAGIVPAGTSTVALEAIAAVVAPPGSSVPALIASRIVALSEAKAAYAAYVAPGSTQHETDADIRAFDAAQLDRLRRTLAI